MTTVLQAMQKKWIGENDSNYVNVDKIKRNS